MKIPRIKNNQKGVILLLTLLILSGILVVTLTAANLVLAGLKMNRLTGYSSIAFFASEAGLERALWEARTWQSRGVPNPLPPISTPNLFSGALPNGSIYKVDYRHDGVNNIFQSIGSFSGVKRSVESTYAD